MVANLGSYIFIGTVIKNVNLIFIQTVAFCDSFTSIPVVHKLTEFKDLQKIPTLSELFACPIF